MHANGPINAVSYLVKLESGLSAQVQGGGLEEDTFRLSHLQVHWHEPSQLNLESGPALQIHLIHFNAK